MQQIIVCPPPNNFAIVSQRGLVVKRWGISVIDFSGAVCYTLREISVIKGVVDYGLSGAC